MVSWVSDCDVEDSYRLSGICSPVELRAPFQSINWGAWRSECCLYQKRKGPVSVVSYRHVNVTDSPSLPLTPSPTGEILSSALSPGNRRERKRSHRWGWEEATVENIKCTVLLWGQKELSCSEVSALNSRWQKCGEKNQRGLYLTNEQSGENNPQPMFHLYNKVEITGETSWCSTFSVTIVLFTAAVMMDTMVFEPSAEVVHRLLDHVTL